MEHQLCRRALSLSPGVCARWCSWRRATHTGPSLAKADNLASKRHARFTPPHLLQNGALLPFSTPAPKTWPDMARGLLLRILLHQIRLEHRCVSESPPGPLIGCVEALDAF